MTGIRAQLGGLRLPWWAKRVPRLDGGPRDEEMVPRWTAEDEIALAERVVRMQEPHDPSVDGRPWAPETHWPDGWPRDMRLEDGEWVRS